MEAVRTPSRESMTHLGIGKRMCVVDQKWKTFKGIVNSVEAEEGVKNYAFYLPTKPKNVLIFPDCIKNCCRSSNLNHTGLDQSPVGGSGGGENQNRRLVLGSGFELN